MDGNRFEFDGVLNVKGIEDRVSGSYELVSDESGRSAPVIAGDFKMDRTKFDIKYRSGSFFEDLGDKMISDEVNFSFKVEGAS